MKIFLDTNVLVAAFVTDHEHHARALPLVQQVHDKRAEGMVSGHSLLEVHAILTRLPRLGVSAAQASTLIDENILPFFEVVVLTEKEYGNMVAALGREGIMGGKCYDFLHLTCAEKGEADRICTFNVRDFAALAGKMAAKLKQP